MPCYYLDHPEHGSHICYTPEDVEAHKAVGWVLREDKPAKVQADEPKKRGRKPRVKHGDQ